MLTTWLCDFSGAVAQDGRVEPGDMILEVNGVSFENMSNDDAVRTLREAVQKPGYVTLVCISLINISLRYIDLSVQSCQFI